VNERADVAAELLASLGIEFFDAVDTTVDQTSRCPEPALLSRGCPSTFTPDEWLFSAFLTTSFISRVIERLRRSAR
jgi:hypothetical protein